MADKKVPSVEELLAKIEALEAKNLENEEKHTEASNSEEHAQNADFLARQAYMNEKVTRRLFKDKDKYKDDLIISVNGKAWQIQRGIEVKIPRFVDEVIASSEKQDAQTAAYTEKLVENYENSSK